MTWQTYVDSNMVGTGSIKYAAIAGLNGALSAKSTEWNITQDELTKIARDFKSPDTMAMNGITIGGMRFFYLSGDENVVRGRKDKSGIHIAKTNSVFLIGLYEEPIQPCQCAKVVEDLADYLIQQNC